MKKILLALITLITASTSFANTIPDPCSGPTALLNLVDRPTASDSACVVPTQKVVLETGFQYQGLLNNNGTQQNLPNAVLRLGLPAKTELVLLIPTYIHQSLASTQGASATTLGIKHQLGYNEHWIVTAETLITPPSGSAAFGSAGTGIAVNGIANYLFNSKWNLLGQIGGSTQTQAKLSGGERYAYMNPDVVLTYSPKDTLSIYGEVYGQSQTAPEQGWGWIADAGIIYLLSPKVAVDLEAGHRIKGELAGTEQYIGAGISFMLG